MQEITLRAYAKVNLWLHVGPKRSDGFHHLLSVMQAISLYDSVTLTRTQAPGVSMDIVGRTDLPTDSRNLAVRAAELFLDHINGQGGVHISLNKRSPIAAGLAGGSTDAAAVLKGMNVLWGEPLEEEELITLGLALGSDVPFCMVGGTCLCAGRGEILSPLDVKEPLWMLVANSGEQISAGAAYAEIDRKGLAEWEFPPPASIILPLEAGNVDGVCANLFNTFEEVVLPLAPISRSYRDAMAKTGALGVLMSGSGPTIFAIYESQEAAQAAQATLPFETHLCHSVIQD